MKMPFPGMDPYLEHPALWPSFHTRLMVAIASQLRPLIRPRYYAQVEERLVIEEQGEDRIPDVAVKKVRDTGPPIATALIDTPLVVETEDRMRREHFVTIHDRYQDMKVVTTIEVLSPTNKTAGPGRRAYRRKQRETLASDCHLVEIDLLRRGTHTLAVREESIQAPPYDYLICVSRSPDRGRFELYPRGLRERLPRIGIPLNPPDADAPLDLQAAVEHVYVEADYVLVVRYDQPCRPRLTATDQQWAFERWREFEASQEDSSAGTSSPTESNGPAE